jgi:hypothetical protein
MRLVLNESDYRIQSVAQPSGKSFIFNCHEEKAFQNANL